MTGWVTAGLEELIRGAYCPGGQALLGRRSPGLPAGAMGKRRRGEGVAGTVFTPLGLP